MNRKNRGHFFRFTKHFFFAAPVSAGAVALLLSLLITTEKVFGDEGFFKPSSCVKNTSPKTIIHLEKVVLSKRKMHLGHFFFAAKSIGRSKSQNLAYRWQVLTPQAQKATPPYFGKHFWLHPRQKGIYRLSLMTRDQKGSCALTSYLLHMPYQNRRMQNKQRSLLVQTTGRPLRWI